MTKARKEEAELDFEKALERLEKLIEAMESGEAPLADLVTQFEEGNRLMKVCEQRLHEAEMRVELLKETKGEAVLEPFGDDAR